MKKATAIVAAIGCLAIQGAFAQTNVTVQGAVDIFAGSLKYSGDAARRSVVNSGGITTSYFGFKGSEYLGGGLRAEFALNGFSKAIPARLVALVATTCSHVMPTSVYPAASARFS